MEVGLSRKRRQKNGILYTVKLEGRKKFQHHNKEVNKLKDALGNEIKPAEQYFLINGLPVHPAALEDFAIEVLGAEVVKNEKPSN